MLSSIFLVFLSTRLLFWFYAKITIFFIENIKVIFAILFKRQMTITSVFGNIVYKLNYKKELNPIVLFEIHKNL